MSDVVFVLLGVGGFLVCAGFVSLCAKL